MVNKSFQEEREREEKEKIEKARVKESFQNWMTLGLVEQNSFRIFSKTLNVTISPQSLQDVSVQLYFFLIHPWPSFPTPQRKAMQPMTTLGTRLDNSKRLFNLAQWHSLLKPGWMGSGGHLFRFSARIPLLVTESRTRDHNIWELEAKLCPIVRFIWLCSRIEILNFKLMAPLTQGSLVV